MVLCAEMGKVWKRSMSGKPRERSESILDIVGEIMQDGVSSG